MKKYIYVSKKTPIYMFSHSKAHKHSKFSITNIREKAVDFYGTTRASALASEIILLTQVPLQKFPFL